MHALCLVREEELMELAHVRSAWMEVHPGSPTVILKRKPVGVPAITPQDAGATAPVQGADGEVMDDAKREAQRRKARAAMILKQSFPFVPFIEAKVWMELC